MLTIAWTPAMQRVLRRLQGHPVLQRLEAFAAHQAEQLFVVGGTIRDICLGRDVHDVDVAMAGDPLRFARRFAQDLGAAYVPLDPGRGEVRVVYRKQFEVDFTRFKGDDLEADLRGRDFTLNALACPLPILLTSPEPGLIDPCHGWPDLQSRRLRLTSPWSLHADPLRQLRAFRLAATHGLSIDPVTLEVIKAVVPRLAAVAAERINSELLKLFGAPSSSIQVIQMADLALLDALFPELAATRIGAHGWDHEFDRSTHALRSYRAVEDLIHAPGDVIPEMAEAVRTYVRADAYPALLKWAALVHAVGQPEPGDTGMEAPCGGAADRSAALWVQIGSRLKLSRAHTEYVKRLIAHQHRPFELATREAQGALTVQLVHQWSKEMGEDVLGGMILALGEALAWHQQAVSGHEGAGFAAFIGRLWQLYSRRILPVLRGPRLVTGDDLRTVFGLAPGPRFRSLLEALEVAHVEGHIRSRAEALQWVENQLTHD